MKTFEALAKENITDDMRLELVMVIYKKAKAGNLKAVELLLRIMKEWESKVDIIVNQSDKLADVMDQIGGEGLEE